MVRGKVDIKVEDLSEDQKSNLQSFKQRRIKDQISMINEYEQNSEKTKESESDKTQKIPNIIPKPVEELHLNQKRLKEEKPLASSNEKPLGFGNLKIKVKTNLKKDIKPSSDIKGTSNSISKLFGFDKLDSIPD